MGFASGSSYPSAFDEALSKPLVPSSSTSNKIGKNKPKAKLDSPTNAIQAASSKKLPAQRTTSKKSSSTSAFTAQQRDSSFSSSAPSSGKNSSTLSSNASTNPFDESNKPTNPFDEGYRPPTLHPRQQEEQQDLAMDSMEDALLRERHTEALEITKNMRQIHEISRDLASIVNDQQAHFDDIEEDAFAIHDTAELGYSHLERAAELARKSARGDALWKTLLGVLVAGAVITVLVVLVIIFGR